MEEALPPLQQAHGAQRDQVMRSVAEMRDYVGEVAEEVKKVTWPDWEQLKSATFVIIVFNIVVAMIIWFMDLGVRGVVNMILDLFAG